MSLPPSNRLYILLDHQSGKAYPAEAMTTDEAKALVAVQTNQDTKHWDIKDVTDMPGARELVEKIAGDDANFIARQKH